MAAFERSFNVGRSWIRDGHDLHVFRWMFCNQHIGFITAANKGRLDRCAVQLLIVEVQSAEANAASGGCLQDISSSKPNSFVEVVLPDLCLFWCEFHKFVSSIFIFVFDVFECG